MDKLIIEHDAHGNSFHRNAAMGNSEFVYRYIRYTRKHGLKRTGSFGSYLLDEKAFTSLPWFFGGSTRCTPMHIAAYNGHLEYIIALIKAGSESALIKAGNHFPIEYAAFNEHYDCIDFFKGIGVQMESPNVIVGLTGEVIEHLFKPVTEEMVLKARSAIHFEDSLTSWLLMLL